MSWLLPATRGVRAALATSLLLLVPWSLCAAAVLAALGAWRPALYVVLTPVAAALATAVLAAARGRDDERSDEDEDDDGGGGQRRRPPRPDPPAGPTLDLDWDAFDRARQDWSTSPDPGVAQRV